MKISIIGLGYVGLPTAALFASKGIHVIGVDINCLLVDAINQGDIKSIEPGLSGMVKAATSAGYLKAVCVPQPADVFIIAVPTPIHTDKSPDLNYFDSAIRSIATVLQKGNLIIIESTIPLQTIKKVAATLYEARPDLTFPLAGVSNSDVAIAYCPERVMPGYALKELVEVPRIIGGLNEASTQYAATVFRLISTGEFMLTDALTAEMVKLTENSYRDVNLAFANELSMLCDEFKINVHEVIALANHHPRVNVLTPGAGVGGHCIPIDPWFMVDASPKTARMIRTAREVNDAKTDYVCQQIIKLATKHNKFKIAILGLSYKSNTDDIRESASIKIILKLVELANITLFVADPYIKELPQSLEGFESIRLYSLKEAIKVADIVVILTAHDVYSALHTDNSLDGKYVIDAVGITYHFKSKSI